MDELFKSNNGKSNYRTGYPAEFKRRVVEESFASGASVRMIANQNAISTSVLYKWRLAHLSASSHLSIPTSVPANRTDSVSCAEPTGLLPIHIADEPSLQSAAAPDHSTNEDLCVVEFDGARLRIRSEVSPSMLRVLIQELSR